MDDLGFKIFFILKIESWIYFLTTRDVDVVTVFVTLAVVVRLVAGVRVVVVVVRVTVVRDRGAALLVARLGIFGLVGGESKLMFGF